MPKMMPIIWVGPTLDVSGYGTVDRQYIFALNKLGIPLIIRPKRFWRGKPVAFSKENKKTVDTMVGRTIPEGARIVVQHMTPENFFHDPSGIWHIAYTVFETDGLPTQWVPPLRGMDEVWTAGQFNIETYKRAGIQPGKTFVIPHGVDTDIFTPDVEPMPFKFDKVDNSWLKDRYVFGIVGDWNTRKGFDAALHAYLNAFGKNDPVALMVKCYFQYPIEKSKEKIINDIRQVKKGHAAHKGDDLPPVVLYSDIIEDEDMPRFYKLIDCLVAPSRGEAFGLAPLEAQACGLPTIQTDAHGHADFCSPEWSYPVSAKLQGIPKTCPIHRISNNYRGQGWWEPSEEELNAAMLHVFNNQEEAKEKGRKARENAKKWSWRVAALKMYKRFEWISEHVIEHKKKQDTLQKEIPR